MPGRTTAAGAWSPSSSSYTTSEAASAAATPSSETTTPRAAVSTRVRRGVADEAAADGPRCFSEARSTTRRSRYSGAVKRRSSSTARRTRGAANAGSGSEPRNSPIHASASAVAASMRCRGSKASILTARLRASAARGAPARNHRASPRVVLGASSSSADDDHARRSSKRRPPPSESSSSSRAAVSASASAASQSSARDGVPTSATIFDSWSRVEAPGSTGAPWYISPMTHAAAQTSTPGTQRREPNSSSGARYHLVAT
mmetsp:Transcript_15399/g.61965  ORF Transcript_15399/g.61965 Transcript_15399/m.61965 type:complete len:259 (-) Transcript_15399:428-1204(-)